MVTKALKKILSYLGITPNSKLRRIWRSIKLADRLNARLAHAEQMNSFLIERYLENESSNDKDLLSIVVFSFDRAFQLDALLGSFSDKVKNANRYALHIIYRASTSEHAQAYDEVLASHKVLNLIAVQQNNDVPFKQLTEKIIKELTSKKIMFLVDDILFTEYVDLDDFANLPSSIYIPSLRLGKNITYSYTAQKEIGHPTFLSSNKLPQNDLVPDTLVWRWSAGDRHWRRMLSVDGNIFDRREYLFMMQNVDFRNPNTLEDQVATAFDEFYKHKLGICYSKSKLVNLPINNVNQTSDKSFDNHYGNIHQDSLLSLWQKNLRMDYQKLYGFNNTGVHQEIPFTSTLRV